MAPIAREWIGPDGKHTRVTLHGALVHSEWTNGTGVAPIKHDTVLASPAYDLSRRR